MLRAQDLMTENVIAVTKDTEVRELAKILTENKISGAPVLDGAGKLVGVVTESDLIFQNKKSAYSHCCRHSGRLFLSGKPGKNGAGDEKNGRRDCGGYLCRRGDLCAKRHPLGGACYLDGGKKYPYPAGS